MTDHAIQRLKSRFDTLSQHLPEENIEFWFARDLMEPLGYARWENFITAIHRAIDSCKTTGYDESNHFRGVTKMVRVGSGADRPVDDFMLTRYACYLIAQNGDPRKQPIAARNLATGTTNYNVMQDNLQGEQPITREHVQNNHSMRHMLGQRGIKPEQLPA